MAEQEELLLQLLATKDAAGALPLDEPMLELTPKEISMGATLPELEEDFEFLCLLIENETAFSNTLHSETEEPQHPPPDVQILTPEPLLSSLTPPRYVMASSPSANSLHLDGEIETIDTQQTCKVMALLDSGATGLFLDSEFVKCHGLTTQPLPKPIPVYNINGMPNKAGAINSVVDLVLCYWNHAEHAIFTVTSLDLLDPPPLAFPCREALYKNSWSSGGAPEEECRGEFGGIHKPELLDKAVEVGDWIYTTTIHQPLSIAEIWASQTTSQWLAQVFTANAAP
ncbi:hypothetical protein E4T56_gene8086 [Termitomyces sp. T112]|nr:hypothetical protein E4T56_gene8086 [Termitomyces sp. T112]